MCHNGKLNIVFYKTANGQQFSRFSSSNFIFKSYVLTTTVCSILFKQIRLKIDCNVAILTFLLNCCFWTMAKTKGAKRLSNTAHTFIDQYNKLSDVHKCICFYYYIFRRSNGTEGWDPDRSGCRDHWRHYSVIYNTFSTPSKFHSRANVS